MGEVVTLDMVTRLDIPAERVTKSAAELQFSEVVICGYLESGEFYFASNLAGGPGVVWILELAKKKLLDIGEDDDGRGTETSA